MKTNKLPVEPVTILSKITQLLTRFILAIRKELRLALRTTVGKIGLMLVTLHILIVWPLDSTLYSYWIPFGSPAGTTFE